MTLTSPLAPADRIVWGKHGDPRGQAQRDAWFAAFRSQPAEFSHEVTAIEGTIPAPLLGSTWFHNGPGLFERGNQRVNHFLDGDGYVCRWALRGDGRVFFDAKFVKTAEFQAEAAADRFLFRSTFGSRKPSGNWLELYLKNPANVNAQVWGEKLLALYEAGVPHRLDPGSLETLGQETMDGQLLDPTVPKSRWHTFQQFARGQWATTAHPHIDPVRQRLVLWHWAAKPGGLAMDIGEYDPRWRRCSRQQFSMAGTVINPHDFALTQNYYVFFENRLAFNPVPFMVGQKSPADCLRLQPDRPPHVHLVPRPDGAYPQRPVQVFDTVPWFSIHQACAYERPDGSVVIYSAGWPGEGLEKGFLSSWQGSAPDFDAIAPTYLWQTTLSPKTKTADHHVVLDNHCIEYPCVHPHYQTQPVRYLYMTYSNAMGESSPPIGYLKLDLHSQTTDIWISDGLSFTEEPTFVPNPNGPDEDDGWLLGMVYDHPQNTSSLVILDAKNIAAGPLCRLGLDHRLVPGLHGSWTATYYGPNQSEI